jgi:spermidine synthase
LKNTTDRPIERIVLFTGTASVVTQLLTIRELLSQFQGNEIVIALILFVWLVLGGLGSRLARWAAGSTRLLKPEALAGLSLWLAALPPLQLLAVRLLRDRIFIHGASVGFYPTLGFVGLLTTPYCLALGFALPFSLFVLRRDRPGYPGGRVYIIDNLGDVSGGVLFSFLLVFFCTPLQAALFAHLPLLLGAVLLLKPRQRRSPATLLVCVAAAGALAGGVLLEKPSLTPAEGELAEYRESLYGRLTMLRDHEQLTLFENGIPLYSSRSTATAEEIVHFPLAQLWHPERILLISIEGGVLNEVVKYRPRAVEYVELNPAVVRMLLEFGLIESLPELKVIYADGRQYLADGDRRYDAIIVNLPEPDTFQLNRFYTDGFFALARSHLSQGGVLSFSLPGYDNYLAEPQRRKLSSLYNTVSRHFSHVQLLPGERIVFVCTATPQTTDIPSALAARGIPTVYISGYFYGNLTARRIEALQSLLIPDAPVNTDTRPYLMQIMFEQWFARFESSPRLFFLVLTGLAILYLIRTTREEFVLFSTGCMIMGSEILVIFAFQIFFGYIYFQIGLIITLFLAGLLPGAILGNRLQMANKRRWLQAADGLLALLLTGFVLAVALAGDRLPAVFFLGFGFAVSLACGFQFPVALRLTGDDDPAATRFFSADLIGAAAGTLVTSVVLVPYAGLAWSAAALIGLKLLSICILGASDGKGQPPSFSAH